MYEQKFNFDVIPGRIVTPYTHAKAKKHNKLMYGISILMSLSFVVGIIVGALLHGGN